MTLEVVHATHGQRFMRGVAFSRGSESMFACAEVRIQNRTRKNPAQRKRAVEQRHTIEITAKDSYQVVACEGKVQRGGQGSRTLMQLIDSAIGW